MKLQSMLCSIGLHKYRTIEMTDCFTTTYVDKNWDRSNIWSGIRFAHVVVSGE